MAENLAGFNLGEELEEAVKALNAARSAAAASVLMRAEIMPYLWEHWRRAFIEAEPRLEVLLDLRAQLRALDALQTSLEALAGNREVIEAEVQDLRGQAFDLVGSGGRLSDDAA